MTSRGKAKELLYHYFEVVFGRDHSLDREEIESIVDLIIDAAREELERPKAEPEQERMMRWFEFAHLPNWLQVVSLPFGELAGKLVASIEPGPERTVALRKLLEAKDAAVRAVVHPGG